MHVLLYRVEGFNKIYTATGAGFDHGVAEGACQAMTRHFIPVELD